jgi:hypothetical protein
MSVRTNLNDCPVFIKLDGIIKPIDVHAMTETEIIFNFVIKDSVCINVLTRLKVIFPIGNQEYRKYLSLLIY